MKRRIQIYYILTKVNEDVIFTGTFHLASNTRRDAEECFGRPWKQLYRDGYRVKQAFVIERGDLTIGEVREALQEAPDEGHNR